MRSSREDHGKNGCTTITLLDHSFVNSDTEIYSKYIASGSHENYSLLDILHQLQFANLC